MRLPATPQSRPTLTPAPRCEPHAARRAVACAALVLLSAQAIPAQAVPGSACPPTTTALVLSGGAAHGLAHIGVIRAMAHAGIRPDYVVGTSMGALIGALYASGMTADQLEGTLGQLANLSAFGAYAPRPPVSLRHLPVAVLFEHGPGGFVLQSAAVREGDINALLSGLLLRGNLLARGQFDSLPIPFRAVATDLNDRSTVVLSRGDLAHAVRASIALPLLFSPVPLDQRMLADGGLADDVPVDVARALGVQRVVVSRFPEDTSSVDFHSKLAYATHLMNLMFWQGTPAMHPGDVEVVTPLGDFSWFDFSPATARQVVALGDSAATHALAGTCPTPSPSTLIGTQAAQRVPALPSRIRLLTTAHANDAADVRSLLGIYPEAELDLPQLASRLQSLKEARAIEGVWLNPSGTRDSLALTVEVERAPRSLVAAGFAYDSDLGGRVWTGLVDRQFAGRSIEGSLILAGGTYEQEVDVGMRRANPTGVNALSPVATLTAAFENIRTFDTTGTAQLPVAVRELVTQLGVERALGHDWVTTLSAERRTWWDPSGQQRTALGPHASLAWLPAAGRGGVKVTSSATDQYTLAEAEAARDLHLGRVTVRPRARLAAGVSIPLHLTFPLGGSEGFAGFRRDEMRGDREAVAAVASSYPLTGLLLLHAEVMAGEVAYRSPAAADRTQPPPSVLVPAPVRVVGARGGIGADTPVGPIRVEYGVNSRRRSAVSLRLGRWF